MDLKRRISERLTRERPATDDSCCAIELVEDDNAEDQTEHDEART